jgi:rhodanese-related sulfurtransferase
VFGARVPSVAAPAVPDDAYLLDVREPDEWVAGHAPNAVHVPLGELVARLAEVPADEDIVVVCRSGARSAQATAYLNQAGRRAVNLDGGMQAWAAAGRPMVSESGAAPVVA